MGLAVEYKTGGFAITTGAANGKMARMLVTMKQEDNFFYSGDAIVQRNGGVRSGSVVAE